MGKQGFTEREPHTQFLKHVVISRVEPSSISEHPTVLYPSVYDMLIFDGYVPCLLLYRMDSTDPSAFSNFIHTVRNSLSQVLSLYYPMAGKWIVADDAWTRKLVCNDEGAVFVEAAVDYDMDKILDGYGFNPPEELTGEHAVPGFEATGVYKTPESKEYPSLIVQVRSPFTEEIELDMSINYSSLLVTRFKCGGVGLTLNFHHMTVDTFAFDRFLKAWGEILSAGQISAKPVFDRSLQVSHLDKGHILGISPDMENVDDVLSSYFKFFPTSKVRHNHISKLFGIRKDAVERLRQKAKEEHVSDVLQRSQRFTTFECICAQLWRCFARIPKVLGATSGEEVVNIRFPVEGRRKWSNPPLPEDYVGNVLMLSGPPMLPGPEVTDKPFSFAASHIHESVVKVNHKTSDELLDELMKMIKEVRSTQETLDTEKPEYRQHSTTLDVVVTSWSRFDNFYNLDFGYGGPFLLSPCLCWTVSSGVSVFLVCPPPKSENAVGLYLRAPPEYINILLEDPEFVYLVS